MKFSNTYIHLGDAFYQRIAPAMVSGPDIALWNEGLAASLGITQSLPGDRLLLARYFSGNQLPEGAEPIALAYAGHQFGNFVPQLGDGRAHLLGEVIDTDKIRRDIQLKGSGPTRFSRQGDGRCALGPAIREYIMSEALHALGIPTSRCLAVVTTGDQVYRELVLTGAVVTRVAASHIRVGTFQYFAARGDLDSLKTLTDYAISRHFPEIDNSAEHRVYRFLESVIEKQIALVVEWMRVGFIHGVMNTDNTAISGETIDFGPCAMMGVYHPGTVFSSIDTQGRYAYGNQALIAQWNMTRLAECLLPLIDSDENQAIEIVTPLLQQFSARFEHAYFAMLSRKLGLVTTEESDTELAQRLLALMQSKQLDYTQTFDRLTHSLDDNSIARAISAELGAWYDEWNTRLHSANIDITSAQAVMQKHNPVVIPRNHHVEAILAECEASGDVGAVAAFMKVLGSPYKTLPQTQYFQDLPADGDRNYQTFCGT